MATCLVESSKSCPTVYSTFGHEWNGNQDMQTAGAFTTHSPAPQPPNSIPVVCPHQATGPDGRRSPSTGDGPLKLLLPSFQFTARRTARHPMIAPSHPSHFAGLASFPPQNDWLILETYPHRGPGIRREKVCGSGRFNAPEVTATKLSPLSRKEPAGSERCGSESQ